ncbi:RHS repeat-associated core domain-containing protein [Streptomyces xanthochromogenes]|uniref:RHS repeat-associated core domain-containing protein n=1 Tax=Streptomyces xanthochromogenes TaxID=67384 RepID=UPI003787437F
MRTSPARPLSTRRVGRAATLLSIVLVAGLLQAMPGVTDALATGAPPAQSSERPVKGTTARAKAPRKDTTVSAPRAPKAAWPSPGSVQVTLPTGGGRLLNSAAPLSAGHIKAGLLPVSLTPVASGPLVSGKSAIPQLAAKDTTATVRVLDREATQKAGVDGVLLTVTAAAGSSSQVKVSVDYSGFADVSGGGFGERLHLVQLPACVLTTPGRAACRTATALAGHNDAQGQTVTADAVSVTGTPTGTKSAAGSQAATTGVTVLAATSSADGPSGDFKASPLASASTWDTSLNSGSFTWSYNMPVPTVPTNLVPKVALSYDSGSIDGRTSNSNNQGSWAGDGFDVSPGFVERSYKGCGDDGVKTDGTEPGDLCWAYDNATISFNGHAGELIPVSTDEWRIKGDDNTKVVRGHNLDLGNGDNDGEYFLATTPDGTRYYFGYNRLPQWKNGKAETKSVETLPVYGNNADEPCHKPAFADSWCQQGRRWNLDLVVDSRGNDISYWYNEETNSYGRNLKDTDGTPYVRATTLDHIEYGQQQADINSDVVKPMARVDFTTAERCLESTTTLCDPAHIDTNKQYWYDTPWDQNCDAGTTCDKGRLSPTFFTRNRLTKITTRTLQTDGTYKPVDQWDLHHKWGTADADYQLLLDSITHTGLADASSVELPRTRLIYDPRIGRLDKDGDGRLPYYKQRLSTIVDESGGQTDVNYSQPSCDWAGLPSPQSNTTHCFPQLYQPSDDIPLVTEWFNKYVVDSVITTDRTGGAPDSVTKYTYLDGGAWAFDDEEGITKEKLKSWSQWRGHGHVRVETGGVSAMSTQTDHYYLRGVDGDRSDPADKTKLRSVTVPDGEGTSLTDDEAWSGFEFRTETFDKPGGKILSKKVSTPWKKETAKRVRDWGTTTANLTGTAVSRSFTSLDAGAGARWRETRTNTSYDTMGRATRSEALGDVSVGSDDTCTRTTYVGPGTNAWILTGAIHTETVAANCAATPDKDTQTDGTSAVLSDVRARFDGQAYGVAPTKGLPTMSEILKSRRGATATYLDSTTTFDAYGRQLTTTALASTSTFDPTDDTKAPVTTPGTNPRTTTTVYTPPTGRVSQSVTTTPPATPGNAASVQTSTTSFDSLRGLPVRTVDTTGRTTDVTYDALGRPLKEWKPDRTKSVRPNIEFQYRNDEGSAQSVATLTLNNDGSQDTAYTLYDGFGRVRQTQAPGTNGGRLLTDTLYDERGQVSVVHAPYYSTDAPSPALFKVIDDSGIETQTATRYDGLGRPVESTVLKGNGAGTPIATTTTAYGGDRVTVTPPQGATPTTTVSDASGHTTELRQYKSGTASGDYDRTLYGYDPAGHQTKVTGPDGAVWSWTYDQLGHQIKAVDPDSGTAVSTYNDRGELVTTMDGRGKTVANVYDNLSRLLETRLGTVTGDLLTSQTWDPAHNQGQLASSTRYAVIGGKSYPYTTAVNAYDALYRPTKTSLTVPSVPGQEGLAGSYVSSSSYNLDGSLQSTTYPAAGSLAAEGFTFTYDKLHQPVTLGSNLSTYLTNQTYSLTGKPMQSTMNAGGKNTWITNSYEYGTQRLAGSRTDQQDVLGASRSTAYSYDQAGNVLSLSDVSRTGTDRQCFQYDYLARLSQAFTPVDVTCPTTPDGSKLGGAAPYWSSYTYNTDGTRSAETQHDPTGNSAKDKTRTYTYPAAGAAHPHSLVSTSTLTGGTGTPGAETYGYDASGNTTERHLSPGPGLTHDQTLAWDQSGHLAGVADTVKTTTPGSSVTTKTTTDYVYDASGSRLTAHTLDTAHPTAENTTLYLGATELNFVKGAAKAKATRYYPLLGATAVRTDDNKVTFQITDHHGTADTSINAADGALTQRRTTPFGQDRGSAPSTWAGTKGFVGGTKDSATGLTHLGAREFDADTGRFISVDPLLVTSAPQSLNGYVYADNNPVTASDPSGLCAEAGCPTRPCPNCQNTTPGHVPGPPKLTDVGEVYGPGLDREDYTSKPDPDGTDGGTKPEFTCDTACAAELDAITQTAPPGPNQNECALVASGGDCLHQGRDAAGQKMLDLTIVDDFWICMFQHDEKACDTWGAAYSSGGASWAATLAGSLVRSGEEQLGKDGATVGREFCSFAPDTPVLLEDGKTKPIASVEVGDKVEAADPTTGEHVGPRRVDGTLINKDEDLVDLTVRGPDGNESTVHTTSKHPFWDRTARAWIPAGKITPGHSLSTDRDQAVLLLAVITVPGSASMYNLTVDQLHTYYVLAGDTPVLVHNSSCGGGLAVLRDWSSQRFQFGNQNFLLDRSGMTHILERHHPMYWDGSVKAQQSFFDPKMSVSDVQDAIGSVMQQNRDTLISRGSRGMYQIRGNVNGTDYVLGLNNGRVGQFYPVNG